MSDLFYLHEYTDGKADTSRSCGFVKFSRQSGWMADESVSISINIKGIYEHGTTRENIYALVHIAEGAFGAIRLKEINIENGFGRAECVVDAGNVSGSGFGWDEIEGIAVVPNNSVSVTAALWGSDDADIGNIEYGVTKRYAQSENASDPSYNEISSDMPAEEYIRADDDIRKSDDQVNGAKETGIMTDVEIPTDEESLEKKEKPENVLFEGGFPADEKIPEGKISVEEISIIPIQRPEITIHQIFEKIEGNPVDAFEDDYFYDCMEITPKQLQQIIGADVSQNSFLMHGYYTFRHILVAKVQDDPSALFVGVPGVYSNRERFMASMFNFNNFKRSHRSDCRNPHFGYWYQEM